jgi:hypothetical protein
MSVLTKTTRALALLAEAEELLEAALVAERTFGDPEERDIVAARDLAYKARREAQSMFRGDY